MVFLELVYVICETNVSSVHVNATRCLSMDRQTVDITVRRLHCANKDAYSQGCRLSTTGKTQSLYMVNPGSIPCTPTVPPTQLLPGVILKPRVKRNA